MVFSLTRTQQIRGISRKLTENKDEFETLRMVTNNSTCVLFAKGMTFINLILLIIDWKVYKPEWNEVPQYIYLYYSYVITLALFLAWLLLNKLRQKNNSDTWIKFFNYSLFYMIVCWCIFLGLDTTKINGQISGFIVCMFCCAAFFYLTPLETLLTYNIFLIIFIAGLIIIGGNTKLLYDNMTNTFITGILAQIGSLMNYSKLAKDFLNKKEILESRQDLETTNQKLNAYEKQRTDFFVNISHELRTPLNVIYSAKQMIDVSVKQVPMDNKKVDKYLKMISQNSYRLLRLINNLIDITKIDESSLEVKLINTDIIKVVEDITLSVAEYIESKGLTLTFDTEVEERIISCDPDKIERIMLNLLSNAVKFAKLCGDITVSIFTAENNICISIKDTGIGIPAEMQDLIFDRFMQVDKSTKRTHEGSGIGLSLVKSLVELQGGRISLKSELGVGSEFLIYLPDEINHDIEAQSVPVDLTEKHIERINIEFSDIYR